MKPCSCPLAAAALRPARLWLAKHAIPRLPAGGLSWVRFYCPRPRRRARTVDGGDGCEPGSLGCSGRPRRGGANGQGRACRGRCGAAGRRARAGASSEGAEGAGGRARGCQRGTLVQCACLERFSPTGACLTWRRPAWLAPARARRQGGRRLCVRTATLPAARARAGAAWQRRAKIEQGMHARGAGGRFGACWGRPVGRRPYCQAKVQRALTGSHQSVRCGGQNGYRTAAL
jgi:hypothetical protein